MQSTLFRGIPRGVVLCHLAGTFTRKATDTRGAYEETRLNRAARLVCPATGAVLTESVRLGSHWRIAGDSAWNTHMYSLRCVIGEIEYKARFTPGCPDEIRLYPVGHEPMTR
jgi:hypothetical protein